MAYVFGCFLGMNKIILLYEPEHDDQVVLAPVFFMFPRIPGSELK